MFFQETVTLPLWLVLLTCLLALLALLDRLLVPGARWFVRRRVNRVIAELNSRLHFRIRPFTMARRRVLIGNLTYDPQVLAAVEQTAREEGLPPEVALARVGRYAREIVPAFNAYLYFRLGIWLARRLARNLYQVRLDHADEAALAAVAEEATVVFVMNHRSNMDYVLIAFLAAPRAALSYAAGEWARVWPLQSLVRAMGAYFVRRDSGNALYRRVLQRYIQMATAAGVTQAVFPEGGLSRDGRLRAPKLGILDYMLRGFQPNEGRDIVFVPVGINYDRVLEDRSLLGMTNPRATRGGTRRALLAGSRFLLRNLFPGRRRERRRFGSACVNFGQPLSLRAHLVERGVVPGALDREGRFAVVEALGALLMAEIGRAVPVPPVPLVASLFAQRPKEYRTLDQLAESIGALAARLRSAGVRLQLPGDDPTSALRAGLRALVRRGVLERQVDGFTVVAGQRDLLAFYANSITHLAGEGSGGTDADAAP